MKSRIPRYTFYETKYGSELLIDVIELKYVKRFLQQKTAHTLTYYDITVITEGEGLFSIDNRDYEAAPRNVFFCIQRYVVYPASLLFRLAKVLFLSASAG